MDQKHNTDHLKAEEYETLFDLLPLMYFVTDEEGLILAVNQTGAETLGYSRDQLRDRSVLDLFMPEDRTQVRKQLDFRNEHSSNIAHWECRAVRQDEAVLWIRGTARAAQRTDGSLVFHIICEDVTQEQEMLEQFKYAEVKYRSLVEKVPAISYAVDLKPRPQTTYISPQIEVLLGYTPEEWVSDASFWHRCIHPDDQERVLDEVMRANVSGNPFFLEYRIQTKSGHYRWIRNHGVYRCDSSGTPRYTHGVMIDITDTKQIEEREQEVQTRLARAERMEALGLMAGGVAHDLNNLLGPLTGMPDLILEQIPLDNPARQDLETMRHSAIRASDIIQDLLTLARRGKVSHDPVDVNQVIRAFRSAPEFRALKDKHPLVDVICRFAPDLPPVTGSSTRLMQVVVNLVKNAFEAITGRGRITISTSREYVERPVGKFETVKEEECVVLRVEDTGCSIPQEDIEHIFEPFYTRKSIGRKGTGLGLAIVYGVIKDMNGSVDLQSRIHEGSLFSLFMPISVATAAPEAPDETLPLTGSERLLVVDDMPEQRELAQRLLSNLGYTVQLAANHDEALDWIRKQRFDLVIIDMIMEDGPDGLDIYRHILRMVPEQRCIIIGGFMETDRVREALRSGAHSFVRKPYTRDKLGRAVRAALDESAFSSARQEVG